MRDGGTKPPDAIVLTGDYTTAARKYIARLEEVSGVRAGIVSTGSERDDTIIRKDVLKERGISL